jgi:hypothetical protein
MMGDCRMKAKSCLRDLFVLGAIGFLIAPPANAADARGFMKGGGVGMLGCPQFLNAMATARQKGGLGSISGIREIDAYASYVLDSRPASIQRQKAFTIYSRAWARTLLFRPCMR